MHCKQKLWNLLTICRKAGNGAGSGQSVGSVCRLRCRILPADAGAHPGEQRGKCIACRTICADRGNKDSTPPERPERAAVRTKMRRIFAYGSKESKIE